MEFSGFCWSTYPFANIRTHTSSIKYETMMMDRTSNTREWSVPSNWWYREKSTITTITSNKIMKIVKTLKAKCSMITRNRCWIFLEKEKIIHVLAPKVQDRFWWKAMCSLRTNFQPTEGSPCSIIFYMIIFNIHIVLPLRYY